MENVYVLLESDPDYISTEVYIKKEDAISKLKEIAKEYDMELDEYEDAAFKSDRYVEVKLKKLN